MSVNNADESHSAHSWADAHPISQAIYFDGDEHPRVATVGAPFVLYIVRRDAPSAVGGIGRVTRLPGAERARSVGNKGPMRPRDDLSS